MGGTPPIRIVTPPITVMATPVLVPTVMQDIAPPTLVDTSAMTLGLPTRAEKRFISENPTSIVQSLVGRIPTTSPNRVTEADFSITAAPASPAAADYVSVVIPHRGINPSNGNYNPILDAKYTFIINPQTAQISRTTEDSQTFARGGWQFGLWGESLVHVSLSGHTPGQYFAYGLTDDYAYFSESWRNLQQLMIVYENNGYWFEGEEANEGPLAPGFTRRHIKKHQDVILTVGNFIWHGMFDEFSVTLDAEHPFRAEFRISFLAWKERFRKTSPYAKWGIGNTVERGHTYGQGAYTAQEQPPPPAGQPDISLVTGLPAGASLASGSQVFRPSSPSNIPQQLSVVQSTPALQAASFDNFLASSPQAFSPTFNMTLSRQAFQSVIGSTG